MNDFLSAILPCTTHRKPWLSKFEKSTLLYVDEKTAHLTCEEAADRIVNSLLEAKKGGSTLIARINGIAHQAGGWSEWLAEQIRKGIEVTLKAGKEMNVALAAAYDKACEAATVFGHFAKDHPITTAVFVTVIAIGVLVILAPYVVEMLGFGEFGPIEGTWAATWQSTYRGLVPKDSLFSYLQRLGMTWK
ncbi:MAG: hypothetical protein Q9176_006363 [Flavoplaca citrina]|nr:MAG: hypothetical protein LQ339_007767 [Xanthoria mediterranea]